MKNLFRGPDHKTIGSLLSKKTKPLYSGRAFSLANLCMKFLEFSPFKIHLRVLFIGGKRAVLFNFLLKPLFTQSLHCFHKTFTFSSLFLKEIHQMFHHFRRSLGRNCRDGLTELCTSFPYVPTNQELI